MIQALVLRFVGADFLILVLWQRLLRYEREAFLAGSATWRPMPNWCPAAALCAVSHLDRDRGIVFAGGLFVLPPLTLRTGFGRGPGFLGVAACLWR